MTLATNMNTQAIVADFKAVVPAVEFWSLRLVYKRFETLTLRQGVLQPPQVSLSCGAHVTLIDRGGWAYAATSQLDRSGFRKAIEQALVWTEISRRQAVSTDCVPRPERSGHYHTAVQRPWDNLSVTDKIDLLQSASNAVRVGGSIVDWQTQLAHCTTRCVLITSDGCEIEQHFEQLMPGIEVVANDGTQTQRRSGGGWRSGRQGGAEQLAAFGFPGDARRIAEEALALLDAPECPSGCMSVLLMPNQMALQIHESIGHALELDRILGDERNFAGGSFLSLDMCGTYRYGSELLNITFDPTLPGEVATRAFDDEGTPAEKEYLIRRGILQRFLGSASSQARSGAPGVASAFASDWNRPAIDRMGNLNMEPGESSMDELIGLVENGVLMDTNLSWSIDDKRNKFQFGCELGRVILDGELQHVVKNPNYRGISAGFWRDLAGVGNADTFEIWSASFCGKGEPQQQAQIGHAAPACVFHDVEVFGGDEE